MNRYQAQVKQTEDSYVTTMANVQKFEAERHYFLKCVNLQEASQSMITRGLIEWRIGHENPTDFFLKAIQAAELAAEVAKELGTKMILDSFLYYLDSLYASAVMGVPFSDALKRIAHLPEAELTHPNELKTRIVQLLDAHYFLLVENGEVPVSWSELKGWLAKKRGFKLYIETFHSYARIIETSHNGDLSVAQKSILDAEKLYGKRPSGPHVGSNWGGVPIFNEEIVDIRLAAVIRKAEEIGGSGFGPLESIHRWRW